MRMFKPLFLALIITSIGITPIKAVDLPVSFQLQGAGYGHGVGLSQIGAKAKALTGESATAILSYYYKDVSIATLDDSKILRVNIGHLLTTAKMALSPVNAFALAPIWLNPTPCPYPAPCI